MRKKSLGDAHDWWGEIKHETPTRAAAIAVVCLLVVLVSWKLRRPEAVSWTVSLLPALMLLTVAVLRYPLKGLNKIALAISKWPEHGPGCTYVMQQSSFQGFVEFRHRFGQAFIPFKRYFDERNSYGPIRLELKREREKQARKAA